MRGRRLLAAALPYAAAAAGAALVVRALHTVALTTAGGAWVYGILDLPYALAHTAGAWLGRAARWAGGAAGTALAGGVAALAAASAALLALAAARRKSGR
ncbi:MAG: hypothetical protein AB1609_05475 [Bacillota bacterium]